MIKNYDDIFKIRAEGLCESCSYGFDKCLNDGKAFCKIEDHEKEVTNCEQKESI